MAVRRPDPLDGIRPHLPTDQYVPAVAAGRLLFVAGHDPERDGRLAYRGRVGRELSLAEGRAAARLAMANALASARRAAAGLARALVVTAFVDAEPDALASGILADALRLLDLVLGAPQAPAVWLRPVQGLAGGLPVEVELVLALRPARRPRRPRPRARAGREAGRGRPRSGARTR